MDIKKRSKEYYNEYYTMINDKKDTTIIILNLNYNNLFNKYEDIINNLLDKNFNYTIIKYNKDNIDKWIGTNSYRCFLLCNEENNFNFDIIKKKYNAKNYEYFHILTNIDNYDMLPKILDSYDVQKMPIIENIIGINIYTKDNFIYKNYKMDDEKKNKYMDKIIENNEKKKKGNNDIISWFVWKTFVDFNKYYFEILNFKDFVYETILFNTNIFYRLIKILENNNINYRADAGTLLGAEKWKGFILHDIDFDLVLLPSEINKILENEDFKKFIDKFGLLINNVFNKKNGCGKISIGHNYIPLNIDLYGIIKKKNFYHLCHKYIKDDDVGAMYNIMEDEFESESIYIKFGKIKIKAYAKDKIKQYLDRTYWGWNNFAYIRRPDYYEVKDINFLRNIVFAYKKINIKNRDKYERKIKNRELFELEKKLIDHYKIHKHNIQHD